VTFDRLNLGTLLHMLTKRSGPPDFRPLPSKNLPDLISDRRTNREACQAAGKVDNAPSIL